MTTPWCIDLNKNKKVKLNTTNRILSNEKETRKKEFIVQPLVACLIPPEAHLLTHLEQCHQNCSPLLSSHPPHSVIIKRWNRELNQHNYVANQRPGSEITPYILRNRVWFIESSKLASQKVLSKRLIDKKDEKNAVPHFLIEVVNKNVTNKQKEAFYLKLLNSDLPIKNIFPGILITCISNNLQETNKQDDKYCNLGSKKSPLVHYNLLIITFGESPVAPK